jgi:hypothetical protein
MEEEKKEIIGFLEIRLTKNQNGNVTIYKNSENLSYFDVIGALENIKYEYLVEFEKTKVTTKNDD